MAILSNSLLRHYNPLKIVATAVCVASLLVGCESTEENEELRIAELKPFNITRHVEVEWREHPGDGVENYFSNLRPAVTEERIFTASRDGEVIALSAKDGDEIWRTDTRKKPPTWWTKIRMKSVPSAKLSGGITAAYNNLYIGTENGDVIALSQETGEVLWQTRVTGEVIAAPGWGEGWITVSTTSGHVSALHPDSGEIRWEAETDTPALTLRGTSTPSVTGGGVLVGTATGKLKVFILDGGIPAWEAVIGKSKGTTELEKLIDADSQPIVANQVAYAVAYNGNLAAVDVLSGRILWQREYSSYRNLTYDNDMLYLTDAKGNIVAVDAKNGIEKWTQSEFYNRRLTQPVVYKDTLVVGDYEGYFHFVDKKTGELVSRFKLDDIDYSAVRWFISWFTSEDRTAYTAPVVRGDLLYIQTRDGEVTALRLP